MSIKQSKKSNHSFFMNLALLQAENMLGNTNDNPAVGCVITKKNSVISAGSTSLNGRPHAEINAINFSKESLKDTHIYSTLEPCSHYGKTKPCVNSIIIKKIKKVFFSINDPDLRSLDKCTDKFKKAKIIVDKGLIKKKINYFYRSYTQYKKDTIPFVTSKLAVSKDFFTARKRGVGWITNRYSRGRVHLMRSKHDCILTSSNTVIKDNPRLTCRINGLEYTNPTIIILDTNLKVPISSKIIKKSRMNKTIIFYNKVVKKKIKILKKSKVKLFRVPLDRFGHINLKLSLLKIRQIGYSRVFLECGVKVTHQFLINNLVDDFKLFISNNKLGKNGKNNFKKHLNLFLKDKKKYKEKVNLLGDKLISYRVK